MWIQSDDEGRYYPLGDPATRPNAQQLAEIEARAKAICKAPTMAMPRLERRATAPARSATPTTSAPPRGKPSALGSVASVGPRWVPKNARPRGQVDRLLRRLRVLPTNDHDDAAAADISVALTCKPRLSRPLNQVTTFSTKTRSYTRRFYRLAAKRVDHDGS